jgi:hypothetical protein
VKRLVSYVLTFALIFSFAVPTVMAENVKLTVNATAQDSHVSIEGNITSGEGQKITVQVLNPSGSIDFIDQTISGEDGMYQFSYTISEMMIGIYSVVVGGDKVSQTAATTFIGTSDLRVVLDEQHVNITGNVITGENHRVTIQVINPNDSIDFIGQTTSGTGGSFAFTYTLSEAVEGTYTVIVGGDKLVEQLQTTFTVSSTPGDGGEPGESGGTPPPSSAAIVTKLIGENGKMVTKVTLNADKLGKAIGLLKNQNMGKRVVVIEVDDSNTDTVEANIPAEALLNAENDVRDAIITIKANQSSFDLPVNLIDITRIASDLGVNEQEMTIKITMEKVSEEINGKLTQKALSSNVKILAAPIEFKLSAEARGLSKTISDFGNSYVTRTIVLNGSVDASKTTAILYDPETGNMTFVPAVLSSINGETHVKMKRNGNSIYSVVGSSKSFADVVEDHWAKSDIDLLASKLLISGMTETEFSPSGNLTRAQFSTLLVRGLGLSGHEAEAIHFSDVEPGLWYTGSIGAALKAGVVSGFDDNTFRPNETITREQMAVMLSNAISFTGGSIEGSNQASSTFKDYNKISTWAKASVAAVMDAEIIIGMTTDTFVPKGIASRAQAATVLQRFLTHVEFINE